MQRKVLELSFSGLSYSNLNHLIISLNLAYPWISHWGLEWNVGLVQICVLLLEHGANVSLLKDCGLRIAEVISLRVVLLQVGEVYGVAKLI